MIPAADLPQLVHTDHPHCFIGLRLHSQRSRFDKYRIRRDRIAYGVEQRMPS